MRRILLIVTVLLLATPALATVTITATDPADGESNYQVVEVTYVADGNDIRAFALDISVDSGATIDGIDDFNVGESTAPGGGYGIFPGKFRDAPIDPEDPNWEDPNYNPVAPTSDPGAQTGLETTAITVELGSLYVDSNAPGSSGTLFTLDVNGNGASDCNLTITENSTRGKVVDEDGGQVVSVLNGTSVFFYNVPAIPASISYPASDPCNGKYLVSWPASAHSTYYEVERSTDGGSTWPTVVYSNSDLSFLTDEPNLSSNRYRVKGCNNVTAQCSGWRAGITDCYVSYCFGPSDPCYSDWLNLVGRPTCWCYPYQCKGDADGFTEGKELFRIGLADLAILKAAWYKTAGELVGDDACADIDRLPEGKELFRVGLEDLDILKTNWYKTDGELTTCQPGNQSP